MAAPKPRTHSACVCASGVLGSCLFEPISQFFLRQRLAQHPASYAFHTLDIFKYQRQISNEQMLY